MQLLVSATSTQQQDYSKPSGTFLARCVQIIHLGTQKTIFKGVEKWKQKVRFTFETPTETKVFKEEKGEEPYVFSKEYTLSFYDQSQFKPMIESWLGRKLTADELTNGFDVFKMIGQPCMITVIEDRTEDGKSYTSISNISAVPKGTNVPPAVNKQVIFTVNEPSNKVFETFPDWIKEKIRSSKEWESIANKPTPPQEDDFELPEINPDDIEVEKIPF